MDHTETLDEALEVPQPHRHPLVFVLVCTALICLGTGYWILHNPPPITDLPAFPSRADLNRLTQTASDSANESTIPINTATLDELDALPGIGPTRAEQIIMHRPYQSISDLQSKAKLPQGVVDKLSAYVRF